MAQRISQVKNSVTAVAHQAMRGLKCCLSRNGLSDKEDGTTYIVTTLAHVPSVVITPPQEQALVGVVTSNTAQTPVTPALKSTTVAAMLHPLLTPALTAVIPCSTLQLPPSSTSLSTLTTLVLSHTQMTHLPLEITHMPLLMSLDASHNKLASLPDALFLLPKLRTLILSDNMLTTLSRCIRGLDGLHTLDLSRNPLHILPAELQLCSIRDMFLDGCPLLLPGAGDAVEMAPDPTHTHPLPVEQALRALYRMVLRISDAHGLNTPTVVHDGVDLVTGYPVQTIDFLQGLLRYSEWLEQYELTGAQPPRDLLPAIPPCFEPVLKPDMLPALGRPNLCSICSQPCFDHAYHRLGLARCCGFAFPVHWLLCSSTCVMVRHLMYEEWPVPVLAVSESTTQVASIAELQEASDDATTDTAVHTEDEDTTRSVDVFVGTLPQTTSEPILCMNRPLSSSEGGLAASKPHSFSAPTVRNADATIAAPTGACIPSTPETSPALAGAALAADSKVDILASATQLPKPPTPPMPAKVERARQQRQVRPRGKPPTCPLPRLPSLDSDLRCAGLQP